MCMRMRVRDNLIYHSYSRVSGSNTNPGMVYLYIESVLHPTKLFSMIFSIHSPIHDVQSLLIITTFRIT